MKLTIYSDKDCVIRHSEKGWPKEPNANSPAYHAIDNTFYNLALQKAKDESIPFEDQGAVILLAYHPTNPENLPGWRPIPDFFYSVDLPGEVEIVEKCKTCDVSENQDCKNIPYECDYVSEKVARIVAKEEKTSTHDAAKAQEILFAKDEWADTVTRTEETLEFTKPDFEGLAHDAGYRFDDPGRDAYVVACENIWSTYVESLRKDNSELIELARVHSLQNIKLLEEIARLKERALL